MTFSKIPNNKVKTLQTRAIIEAPGERMLLIGAFTSPMAMTMMVVRTDGSHLTLGSGMINPGNSQLMSPEMTLQEKRV